jgi:hypothetical protein
MGSAVKLREDYSAARVRALARRSGDANQTRRLLALSAIYKPDSVSVTSRFANDAKCRCIGKLKSA